MKIAVASGKGGTGKTTVAVSIALSAKGPVSFVDCDVEEPNSHIFLKPKITGSREIHLTIPEIDQSRCDFCGKCRDICSFNAITIFGQTIMTFPDMCHSCGGCFLVCDKGAITEGSRSLGVIEWGDTGNIKFFHGKLRVGEAMSSPLIKETKKEAELWETPLSVFDAPPGTSCPVIKTVRDADYVILVAESTPFGLHDLQLAAATILKLGLPTGVIINKAGLGDDSVAKWCKEQGLPLLMEIPFSRKAAEAYATGQPLVTFMPELKPKFQEILEGISQ
ncbi:MAG: (4Fe-4S)-binding protein [Thermodesulfobacteria bacterium]|nr:(4Fe-4S)-binding protein [Thermodesulfobacteriota bacterium]